MTDCDVLIVGAGPTGLVLALWLTKLGVKARIVDKTAGPGTASRALAVQARTLELYRQLDLAEAVIERAHRVPGVNLWTRGENRARIAFEDVGRGVTRFPGLWIFPQDEHERILIDRLSAMGVLVERERELIGFSENAVASRRRCATRTGPPRVAKRAYWRLATARTPSSARASALAFLAATTPISSMSPTSRLLAPRSTVNCISIWTKPIF